MGGRFSGLMLVARSARLPVVPGVGARLGPALPPYTEDAADDEPDSTWTSARRFWRLAVKLPGPSSPVCRRYAKGVTRRTSPSE